MIAFLQNLHPVIQALLATCFTWAVTALGAAVVFIARDVSKRVLDTMLGFAAGVMIAASYWSLLAPAIEMSEGGNLPVWVPPAVGFIIGAAFLRVLIRYFPTSTLAFPLKRLKVLRRHGGAAPCLSSP